MVFLRLSRGSAIFKKNINIIPTTIYFTQQLRSRWPKPLAEEWSVSYPLLFDHEDLRLARNQPVNHFCEWLAAIHLFQRDGALSLIEKYLFGRHPRKHKVIAETLNPDQLQILKAIHDEFGVQPPDLFVFSPNRSRFWFAEVKGPGDKLRETQKASHAAIREKLGVPVEVMRVTVGAA